MGSIQAATQLQITTCEDGRHLLDDWTRICSVGGYFSGTFEVRQMGYNLECFGDILSVILVHCLTN
jgi:hypothetical protein